jgi:hypothetical protein
MRGGKRGANHTMQRMRASHSAQSQFGRSGRPARTADRGRYYSRGHMKLSSIAAVTLLLCVAAYLYQGCKPVWQFDHLECNARRVITGPELQRWATNLLAHPPESTYSSIRMSQLGTNFPERLRGLAPKLGPHVFLYEAEGTNSPAWVMIGWGSGFLGHCGFEIGPTNFVSRRPSRAWQPGVYFWNDH